MMILVVGATGQLGSLITRRLLAEGRPVRILVRPHSAYQLLVDAGAVPVSGDLKEPASLPPACEGVETVITTANSAQRGGADNVQTVDLEGNHHLIDAAKAAGVRQFVFTSGLGMEVGSPVPFFQAKARSEAHLRASGMPYTILAANAFMESWLPAVVARPALEGQPVTIVGEGRRRHTFVSLEDVAAFGAAVMGHPEAINRYLPIGGPEALSWRDIVATFERVLGHPIPLRTVPPGAPVPGLPEMISQFLAALDSYDTPLDMTETARTFGVRLTTVEEFVRRVFGGAAE